MSLQLFKNTILKRYIFVDVKKFFRTTEKRNDPVYRHLMREGIFDAKTIEAFRASFKQKKSLDRNPFCRAVGVGSKNIDFSHNPLEMDVEMAVLLALSFSIVGDDELEFECNDIPRGDKHCAAQNLIFDKIKGLKPYRRFDNFYERAEFFFLNYVTDITEKEFVKIYSKIKKMFVPYNADGKKVEMALAKYNGVLVYDHPLEVYVNVSDGADVYVLAKGLKSMATKCVNNKFMKNVNNPLIAYDITRGDANVYFFVQMLLSLNNVMVPVVSGYTGNVEMLSIMLVAAKKRLYFKDSLERPKYASNSKHFNDFLVLYTVKIENECHINYSLPEFNSLMKKIENQREEFLKDVKCAQYAVFRCTREFASCYEYGHPDFTNLNSVWVTRSDLSMSMEDALRYNLCYGSLQYMMGAYIGINKMEMLGLGKMVVVKISNTDDQEEIYTSFKSLVVSKEEKKEIVIVEKPVIRSSAFKKEKLKKKKNDVGNNDSSKINEIDGDESSAYSNTLLQQQEQEKSSKDQSNFKNNQKKIVSGDNSERKINNNNSTPPMVNEKKINNNNSSVPLDDKVLPVGVSDKRVSGKEQRKARLEAIKISTITPQDDPSASNSDSSAESFSSENESSGSDSEENEVQQAVRFVKGGKFVIKKT